VTFTFDGDPERRHRLCDVCREEHETDTGFVLRDGDAYAVYWASWYPHENEAWLDVVVGSWEEPKYRDNVTFGCRIGYIEGQDAPACSLVEGGKVLGDAAIFGQKLTRDEALAHPWLDRFWELVDWLIGNDPILHEHVFHMPPRSSP